jgi:hypothetical protein
LHQMVYGDHEYRLLDLRPGRRTQLGPRRRVSALTSGCGSDDPPPSAIASTRALSLVFKDRPSAVPDVARPLPVDPSTREGSPFGSKLPPFELVPPLPFLPASTVYSASTSCRCVATRSRPWGSPRFRSLAEIPPRGAPSQRPFPVARDPSKLFPRLQPYRITTAWYLLAVPPVPGSHTLRVAASRVLAISGQPTSRSCSTAESVAAPGVATRALLDAPLGLFPFIGFDDSSARPSKEVPPEPSPSKEGRSRWEPCGLDIRGRFLRLT